MALAPEQRRRYARHLLLADVGEAGQELLCAARVTIEGDARAADVARAYLERAGVASGGETITVETIDAPAGLEEAAAFLAGAIAATEHIKKVLGVGTPGALPDALIAPEDA